MSKQQAGSIKLKSKRLSIRRGKSMGSERDRGGDGIDGGQTERESSLPPAIRTKLWRLFEQIEREFENMHAENLDCKLISADP